MNYGLPTSVEIDGEDVPIRSDFRAILDIIGAMNDPDLDDYDKTEVVMAIFYPDHSGIKDWDKAMARCFEFIDCGKPSTNKKNSPRLIDWEQDFDHIIAPINRVLGYESRAVDYLHWWTFMAAYTEIGGDCVISQVISLRDKLKRGKKLEKYEREWYRRNREIVDMQTHYSEEQEDILKDWA